MSRIRRFVIALTLQQIFLLLILALYWWLTRRPESDMVIAFPRPEGTKITPSSASKTDLSSQSKTEGRPTSTTVPTGEAPPDDLQKIQGIGPKMSALLIDNGITTFCKLASQSTDDLVQIVRQAGARIVNPETWPEQAALASTGNWDALDGFQSRAKRQPK